MDLRFMAADATPAETRSRREDGGLRRDDRGARAGGSRRSRSPQPSPSAAPRPGGTPVGDRMGKPGRAQRDLPPPGGASRRSFRSGVVLRLDLDRGDGPPSSFTSVTTWHAGNRGAANSSPSYGTGPTWCPLPASGCVTAARRRSSSGRGATTSPSRRPGSTKSSPRSTGRKGASDGTFVHPLQLLSRVGVIDPRSLAEYRETGGYRALSHALTLGPAAVIEEVKKSGLKGRGGAAFPTGVKWEAVAREPGPKIVVCNADESEPGTFKDRVVMEGDPFALVEAMTIAGYAVGAERGYLYIRGEYPRAIARMTGCDPDRPRSRVARQGHPRVGFFVRYRDPPRARRLHLRRGNGSVQLDRGLSRRTPPEATVPGAIGPLQPSHRHQQRRDSDQRQSDRPRGRRGLCDHRHRRLDRHPDLLPFGGRHPAGNLRGRVRCDPDRPHHPGGRSRERHCRGPAGWGGRHLRRHRGARPAPHLRRRPFRRGLARVGRHHGVQLLPRYAGRGSPGRPLLPGRELWSMRPLPGGDGSGRGGAGPGQRSASTST